MISAAAALIGAMVVATPGPQDKTRPEAADGKTRPPGATAELPRTRVDTSEPTRTGRTIHVPGGADLQVAIDQARPGDWITLEAGQTYEGPFRLPNKGGTAGDPWIVITSASRQSLPSAGQRVAPSDASGMAKLIARSRSVIVADPGAHHYRLVGLELAPNPGSFLYAIVQLGDNERDARSVPHHIIVDRCYVHGDAKRGSRRGIALNARDAAVIDSYLSDFKEVGADSQAIGGWNGPGPFRIANNYLEAAGENVMFGGADPSIENLVPADIEVLGNHMAKPLRWKLDDPTYEGTPWAVKNLFELKNARRVLIDGNLLEQNWPHAQNGFAVLFTVRNQDGGAPWSAVEDVTFRNNVVRHVAAGFNILGYDDNHTSRQTRRIAIRNNLITGVGGKWGGNGRLFQLLNGTSGVAIEHNTAEQSGGIVFGGDHAPHTDFVFQNNVMRDNAAGFVGSGTGAGKGAIDRYFPGAVITGNVFLGGKADDYPPGNVFSERETAHGRPAGADTAGLMSAMNEVICKR